MRELFDIYIIVFTFLGSPNLSKLDPILVKQSYSAFVSFILEGAKWNSDPLQIK